MSKEVRGQFQEQEKATSGSWHTMNLQNRGNPIRDWTSRQLPSKGMIYGQYCVLERLEIATHGQPLYQEFTLDSEGDDWTFLPSGPFNAYSEFEEWLSAESKLRMFYSIKKTGSDIPIGIASYHDIDLEHGVIEVGSVIFSRSLQRTRIGTEAMYLMMKYVFDELGYRRYQWRCNALNIASKNAAERLGFKFEGVFRQAHVFKGYNRDTAWYSIIDIEWPEIKARFMRWLDKVNFDENGNQKNRLQEI